jgi:hypothetical protein
MNHAPKAFSGQLEPEALLTFPVSIYPVPTFPNNGIGRPPEYEGDHNICLGRDC